MTQDPKHESRRDPPNDPADDPRLTAYALGELPASERAEVEAIVAGDPAARAFVEETRAFASALGPQLAAEGAPSLTDAQRTTIRDRVARSGRVRVLRLTNWSVPAGVAAALLVGVTFAYRHEIGAWWSPERDVARGVASAGRPANRDGDGLVGGARPDPTPGDRARVPAVRTPADGTKTERDLAGATSEAGPRPLDEAAQRELPPPAPKPPSPPPVASLPPDAVTRAPVAAEPASAPQPPSGPPQGDPKAPASGAPTGSGAHALGGSSAPGGGAGGPTTGGGGAPAAVGYRAGGGGGGGGGRVVRKEKAGERLADGVESKYRRSEVADSREPSDPAGGPSTAGRPAGGKDSPESYRAIEDNPFRKVLDSALSTFGIDVDTASYANVRRFLRDGQLPPPGAVRIEEMVNTFRYRYAPPTDGSPFAVHAEVAGCPWDATHRLVRVGLKGREVDLRERPQSNLVFLVDVSGSMQPANKLPLLVESMKLLVNELDARDKVSIVVYAGAAGVVLPPTPGDRRQEILASFDRLRAGGSTAGGAGIELAYRTAQENFVPGGINRVILATDGDFNVGVSDESSLVRLVEEKAKSKVFLTVLGFGTGNLQDSKMEALADKGNGNYSYVDSLKEGRKVLVEEAAGTLLTIAKDVKLQVEFNPVRVAEYRLIGYENRVLATEDFANDRKDAGDLGAGHTVTALYEIVPTTVTAATASEPLRYQQGGAPTAAAHTGELLTVKLRYKAPEADTSVLREVAVQDSPRAFDSASAEFHLAASVAAFGMLLRGSPHKGGATWDMAIELARGASAAGNDEARAELVEMIRTAKSLAASQGR